MIVNRQHPILSPLAFLSAALLMAGVGVAIWVAGGAAFSPGPLSASGQAGVTLGGYESHAGFEHDCEQCHAPMHGVSTDRCEACHAREAEQRRTGTGLHGAMDPAAQCAECHPEHQGSAFDVAAAGLRQFDHAHTRFELTRHIQDYAGKVIECSGCHAGTEFEFSVAGCVACHDAAAPDFMHDHLAAFGDTCLDCHDGADKTASFDHNLTALPLEFAHATLACAACHTAERAPDTLSAECGACHAEPPVHVGVFGSDCADCHLAAAWTPASLAGQPFRHADKGFSLDKHVVDFAGQTLACLDCHQGATSDPNSLAADTGAACLDCHASAATNEMAEHIQRYGPDCAGCHDGGDRMAGFEHAQVFVLDGAHAPLACAVCHAEQQFRDTPNECAGCHAEPEIHAGSFGSECAACHTTAAWLPAGLRAHTFPLDHGETGVLACVTCHTQTYAEYTCYGCHAHEPQAVAREHTEEGIRADELADCAACHPTGQEE